VSGIVELRPVLPPAACAPATTTVPTTDPTADSTTDTTIPALPEPTASVPGAEFLPTLDGAALCLGPAAGTGEVFERGSAGVDLDQSGGWVVNVNLRSDGRTVWNALATECFNTTPTCPSTIPGSRGQLAIVLDGVVQSSPQVNEPVFDDNVSITGSFSEGEARSLSRVLNRGAFPIDVEPQEARTVSPSAGSDSLQAAIIAGLIGAALVLIYLVIYYRLLALVIVGGLVVWAMTVFVVASMVSGWTS
jgi:preprotein translocase subunit SecD